MMSNSQEPATTKKRVRKARVVAESPPLADDDDAMDFDLPPPVMSSGVGVEYAVAGAVSAAAQKAEAVSAAAGGEEPVVVVVKRKRVPPKKAGGGGSGAGPSSGDALPIGGGAAGYAAAAMSGGDDLIDAATFTAGSVAGGRGFGFGRMMPHPVPVAEDVGARAKSPSRRAKSPSPPSPKRATSPKRRRADVMIGGGEVPPSPKTFVTWSESLPVPSVDVAANPKANQEAFIRGFRNYIYILVSAVYDDSDVTQRVVAPANLALFLRAFTDVTFASNNYETLEKIGDLVMGTAFAKHVYAKMPKVTPQEMTNLSSNLLSKRFQSQISTDLKMHQWVLLGESEAADREAASTPSVREDVLEAFFAALSGVADRVHADYVKEGNFEKAVVSAPCGSEIARRMVDFMFDHYGLKPEMMKDAPQTILNNVGTLFGLRKYGISFLPKGKSRLVGPRPYSVVIPEQLRAALASEGIIVDGDLLSSPEGHATRAEAAEAALEKLQEAGMTEDWMHSYRERTRFGGIDPKIVEEAMAIVRRRFQRTERDFVKPMFKIPSKSIQEDGLLSVIFVISDSNDVEHTLGSATGYSITKTKERVLAEFIRKNTGS
jgi:dsRNA-specific ribonuclease